MLLLVTYWFSLVIAYTYSYIVLLIVNAGTSEHNKDYAEFLYQRLQRKGYLYRDCVRLVNYDRNVFGACMLALGHADAMVTGVTRNWTTALQDVRRVLDPKEGRRVIGVSVIISRGRVIFVADTSIHDMPTSEELADIAVETAGVASRFGITPRVAMLAYSTFGHPDNERAERVREAVNILDQRGADFEYDGEMGADIALNRRAMAAYPFCPADRYGERPHHARLPCGEHLHQDAARAGRRHCDRPHACGALQARANRLARFQRQRPCEHGGALRVRRNGLRRGRLAGSP